MYKGKAFSGTRHVRGRARARACCHDRYHALYSCGFTGRQLICRKPIYTTLCVFDEPNIKEHKKDFERILEIVISEAFFAYHKEKGETPDLFTLPTLQDIIKKTAYLKCDIEIIGYWIYCFHTENVQAELEQLGFWHSSKHKAHIYSGKKKSRYATKTKLADMRTNKAL